MARSVSDIKRTMTDAFMADATIRERYDIREGDTFSSVFSPVSLESILFFVVASAHYVLERIFDRFKVDISERIERGVVATIPWYHRKAMDYQHGDALHLNTTTYAYEYPTKREEAKVVRYASIKDMGGILQILVSGEEEGRPSPLSADVLTAFKAYMNAIKIAGTVLSIRSAPADVVRIGVEIQIDPMVLRTDGTRIADGTRPIEDAITAYLGGILYGGVFNKTKLVDAIQAVEGVVDITLGDCSARSASEADFSPIVGNNYTAFSGCFIAEGLTQTITYVV